MSDATATAPCGRLPEGESHGAIIETIPRDGREVRVRIGRRWYAAAWAFDTETGEEFLGVKLNGADWVRVAQDVIEEVGAPAGAGRHPKPQESASGQPKRQAREAAGSRQQAARKPVAHCPLPIASKSDALISIDDVAARVTAMVRTLHVMPDIEARFLTAGSRVNWPATVYTWEDLRAQAENHENRDSALKRPRHKATPADLAQLDETWGWFGALDPLTQKERKYLMRGAREGKKAHQVRTGTLLLSSMQRLVWRHALGDSFARIAKETGEHHETIRRRHGRAIERLAAIADAALTKSVGAARVRVGTRSANERPTESGGRGAGAQKAA